MNASRRWLIPSTVALVILLAATGAVAATPWPSLLEYSTGISTDKASRLQLYGALSGPIAPDKSLKVGGWWVAWSSDNRACVADAYVDYTRKPIYLAAGRKFIFFGPAGILVSPGLFGGEAGYTHDRLTVQALAGTLAFTPVSGGTRFTFAGNRSPADESIRAARVQAELTPPAATRSVTLGLNVLGLLDDTGTSADATVDVTSWLSLFGETAEFADVHAHAYGIHVSDQHSRRDPNRYTLLAYYHRKVPIGFLPATVGATSYFENQTGWAGGLYHQMDAKHGIGVFADRKDAILTLFVRQPLR
jgi:hypothetical protein